MKIFFHLLNALFLAVTLALTTACGEGGTETGNPQIQDEGDDTGGGEEPVSEVPGEEDSGGDDVGGGELPSPSTAEPTTAEKILDQICDKLTDCFGWLVTINCEEGILEVSNIDDDLGLDDPFESYQAIIDAEILETITPNEEETSTCLTEISELECSSQRVQSAYSVANPANFNNIHSMIPDAEDSCGRVY